MMTRWECTLASGGFHWEIAPLVSLSESSEMVELESVGFVIAIYAS